MPNSYGFSSPAYVVNENAGTLTVTITRSSVLSAETVFLSTAQTEGYGNSGDYTGLLNTAVSFAVGQSSASVIINITNDSVAESSETFAVLVQGNVSDPVTTYLAKATFTIVDDDAPLTLVGTSGNDTLNGLSGNDSLSGGDGNDTLYGAAGADTLLGGNGNDSLDGGDGNDFINGGAGLDIASYNGVTSSAGINGNLSTGLVTGAAGNDTLTGIEALYGSKNADTLTGSNGDDTLYGGKGNDGLYGGKGNDTLDPGSGVDTVDGGDGTDVLVLALSRASYQVTQPSAGVTRLVTNDSSVDVTLSNVENVQFSDGTVAVSSLSAAGLNLGGTTGIDIISGSSGNDTITGLAGADSLSGFDGNDSIDGGDDNDALNGGNGDDTLLGGNGNDFLSGGAGDDSISGGSFNDTIDVGSGIDTVDGGTGTDLVVLSLSRTSYWVTHPSTGVTELISLVSNDDVTLTNVESVQFSDGTVAVSSLGSGTGGNDVLSGTAANDTMTGLAGDDALFGDDGNDSIDGGDGNDSLYGGSGIDTLLGGNGNDWLDGGPGNDVITGGAGLDTANYGSASSAVNASLATGVAASTEGNDTLTGIEALYGSKYGDTLTGSDGSDSLYGAGGNDSLYGGKGDDTLDPGTGVDTVNGGDGTDVLVLGLSRASYQVTQPSAGVTRLVNSASGIDVTLSNVENVQFSDATVAVSALTANHAPTGTVTITGTPSPGQTLTASNTLADADGLGAISYQWLLDGASIAGATGNTLLVGASQVGHAVSVTASYVDLLGAHESVTSSATTVSGQTQGFNVVVSAAAAALGLNDQSSGMFSAGGLQLGIWLSTHTSWGAGQLSPGQSGTIDVLYLSGYTISLTFTLNSSSAATLTEIDLFSPQKQAVLTYTGSLAVTPASLFGSLSDSVVLNGADTITGNSSNNRLQGYGGNDTINGAGGTDTAVFSLNHTGYSITQTTSGLTVSGPDGIDQLTSVERLQFPDGNLAFDFDGTAGEAYRLYQAAFDRVPDLPGLGYQINDLDTRATLEQVATNFIASPEFQSKYGSAVSDTAFVTLLYENVLHREPDPGGLQFHLDELKSGQTRADVLIHFSESPENQANVMGSIANGIFYIPYIG